jgi:phage host-nuclease inhibitor protein Gam
MRNVLYDTKALAGMTLGQLMDKVNLFAPRRVKVLAAKAAMDKRIAEYTAREQIKFDQDFGTLKIDTDLEEKEIALIIINHKEWFDRPRTQKTANCEFGLRKSPDSVKINDAEAIIQWSDDNQIKLYDLCPTINKDAVAAAIVDGNVIPGAELISGERAFVKVKTDNLDNEMKRG